MYIRVKDWHLRDASSLMCVLSPIVMRVDLMRIVPLIALNVGTGDAGTEPVDVYVRNLRYPPARSVAN